MWKFLFLLLVSCAVFEVKSLDAKAEVSTEKVSSSGLSTSRVRVIAEGTRDVLKLKLYALTAALKEASNINEYKREINSIVKVSLQNIDDQIADLDSIVKNATAQARSERTSISRCIRKERRSKSSKVRRSRILKCRKSFSFDVCKLKLSKLSYVKVDACSIIPTCSLLHPISNRNLQNCIRSRVSKAYSTANLIKSQIEDDALEVYDKASNCIEDNLGDLDLDIEQISDEFNECVESKLREDFNELQNEL